MKKSIIEVQCRFCGKWYEFEVDIDNFIKWYNGEGLIQNLLSDLEPKYRELLISKTCDECFKKICGIL